MSHLLENLLIFGRVLRGAGIEVHPGRLLDVVDALGHVNLSSRDDVYYTCRALLVHRREQIAVFDRAFAAFWRSHREIDAHRPSAQDEEPDWDPTPVPLPGSDVGGGEPEPVDPRLKTWSASRGLATKDFAAFTADEVAEAREALSRLVWSPGERRTRRWVRGNGRRIDLRRAIAESLRTGGDVVRLPRRTRRTRRRRLVLLCDISGSMERYSRMLLHFTHAIVSRHGDVEAFVFSTSLSRITRQLRTRRSDEALAAVSRSVHDWSGGTRIGAAVKEFHQRWGRRVMNGGPVTLLISDGWDRGDPSELAVQISRLQRSCHRLVWLSPLIGSTGYEPLTRGLQAALPFVDDFLPARTLTNLTDLATHLNALD
jgi:uncharacterized protein